MKLKSKIASILVGCSLMLGVGAAYAGAPWIMSEKKLAVYKCSCQTGDETVYTQVLSVGQMIWYRAYNCNSSCCR